MLTSSEVLTLRLLNASALFEIWGAENKRPFLEDLLIMVEFSELAGHLLNEQGLLKRAELGKRVLKRLADPAKVSEITDKDKDRLDAAFKAYSNFLGRVSRSDFLIVLDRLERIRYGSHVNKKSA